MEIQIKAYGCTNLETCALTFTDLKDMKKIEPTVTQECTSCGSHDYYTEFEEFGKIEQLDTKYLGQVKFACNTCYNVWYHPVPLSVPKL